jgi:SAM-dependent methyltransferase
VDRQAIRTFDTIAEGYADRFADELDRNEVDRSLLDAVIDGPVLEVGAGPAQAARLLRRRGIAALASDASVPQVRTARALDGSMPVLAADQGGLPVQPGSLAGVVALYSLIFGPVDGLDAVFADWAVALRPGAIAVLTVHAGDGEVHATDWHGTPIDVTVVLRDPDDVTERLRRNGFVVERCDVRPPLEHEYQADHLAVVARRAAGQPSTSAATSSA